MSGDKQAITILLVDDIPETRESIKKLLAFEPDFKVIGVASNGREGVEQAKELKPDIVIMDINMPDMDGLEAASLITKVVPTVGVIMMSVQNDADYMRKAMLAGARNFLGKPVSMDELYSTIRNVYQQYEPIRMQMSRMGEIAATMAKEQRDEQTEGTRAGNVIVIYSPTGGAGCTMLATNLASAMMKEGVRVLLMDADVQFGDVGAFLNMQPPANLNDLVDSADEMDIELFENIVATHDSGLKVVVGPSRPEHADPIRANPSSIATIISSIAGYYDFIIVDTSSNLDEILLPLMDMATRILLLSTPTLPSVKNIKLVLELFEQLGYEKDKIMLTINQAADDRNRRQVTLAADRIQNWLKHPVAAQIPAVDERVVLSAINKGVPLIAAERDHNKPPVKQIIQLADSIFNDLMGTPEQEGGEESKEDDKKGNRLFGFSR